MNTSAALIDRTGFENWAFNVFVNLALENNNLRDGYTYEQSDLSLVIKSVGDNYNVALRCYHSDRGWLTTNFDYKHPVN
jgi:hypothetical protein